MENDCFADALAIYLDWHRGQRHSPRTIQAARERVGVFVAWLRERGVRDVTGITGRHLMGYEGHLAGRLAPWSARTTMLTIKGWLNWCTRPEVELLAKSPAGRNLPKAEKLLKPFLTREQFARVEAQAKKDSGMLGARRLFLVWLLCTTGLRSHEVAELQLASIDRGTRRIRVMGKGAKERIVPLAPEAHLRLVNYLRFRQDALGALWITEEGRPMTAEGLVVDLRRLMDNANVKVRDRWHIWRRTWAANASRQGVPSEYILAVAGWEDGAMLARYARSMRQEEEAVDRLRELAPWAKRKE